MSPRAKQNHGTAPAGERERLRAALRASADLSRWLARFPDASPDPVLRVSADGVVLYRNAAAVALPGWLCEVGELLPQQALLRMVGRAMSEDRVCEQDLDLGGMRYSVSVAPVVVECYANVYGRDVSARWRAEVAAQESEERLRTVLRNTRCILWSGTIAGRDGWQDHPEWRDARFEWNCPVLDETAANEVVPLDVPAGMTYARVWARSRHPDDHRAMHDVAAGALLRGDDHYVQEFRCTDRDGHLHWLREDVALRTTSHGHWRAYGIATDITGRKLAEDQLCAANARLSRAAADLARSNAELEQFASVAGHDLQEPLRMVGAFLTLLTDRCGAQLDARSREYVEYAIEGATRMSQLIQDLLDYGRVERRGRSLAPTDAGVALAAALTSLRGAIAEAGATVTQEPLPMVAGDAAQLTQLFQNLIGNAIKFRAP